jgi:hypothetical protein
MGNASTIPYQLRPHKAIDRNLMISILKKLDRYSGIDLEQYRYVGFGGAFLDDFKLMHLEFGIHHMDCIEGDKHAYSRQQFNNPYRFLNLYLTSSTDYISGTNFKYDKSQFFWLDYAEPGSIKQQLLDIELLAEKLIAFDILKVTFNAKASSFASSHAINEKDPQLNSKIVELLKKDQTYELFLPDHVTEKNISDDFSMVIRAMAVRAINRGLTRSINTLSFNHIASFSYQDGQRMTTMIGIICEKETFKSVLKESGLNKWEFFQPEIITEFIGAHRIEVPAMTVMERVKIDKHIPIKSAESLSKELKFAYGQNDGENLKLLEGYCKYYKYLPYYSKVTY